MDGVCGLVSNGPSFDATWSCMKDATREPAEDGYLANELPTYGPTLGLPVRLQFQSSTSRPTVHFAQDQDHKLAREARDGISGERYHEILDAR